MSEDAKKYFSISEAAKMVHMSSETLRHYDRIGLVKPGRKDEWTNYRYYTRQDLVRLNTVRALQIMDLPLQKIKTVLEYNDLEKIVAFLEEAEKKADEKIAMLKYGKSKIRLARADYERKLTGKKLAEQHDVSASFIREFPERVILLSDTLEEPTLDNLWNYLANFYDQVDPAARDQFDFEDQAGIYTEAGRSRLFAICIRHGDVPGLKILPAGKYLCADCAGEDRENALDRLIQTAAFEYQTEPRFVVWQIVISGILNWNYQAQIYVGK